MGEDGSERAAREPSAQTVHGGVQGGAVRLVLDEGKMMADVARDLT